MKNKADTKAKPAKSSSNHSLDLMIDIETLGTVPGSIIFEIAAVSFNPNTYEVKDTFHTFISPQSCRDAGLVSDESTEEFWLERGVTEISLNRAHCDNILAAELLHLDAWIYAVNPKLIWCKGLDFDLPLLKAAFAAVGRDQPWKYYQGKDLRTVWSEAFPSTWEKSEDHSALNDCYNQITLLRKAREEILIPKWISVDDELPDDNTTVMIHHPDASEPVWLGYCETADDGETEWFNISERYPAEVTLWMDLPSTQKEEREGV